ncbi:MAG: hypothetical protein AAF985_00350 [Bacteroidota bacterium]
MKNFFLVFAVVFSFALLSNANASGDLKSDALLEETIELKDGVLHAEDEFCFYTVGPAADGKCYEYCFPLWQPVEIECL